MSFFLQVHGRRLRYLRLLYWTTEHQFLHRVHVSVQQLNRCNQWVVFGHRLLPERLPEEHQGGQHLPGKLQQPHFSPRLQPMQLCLCFHERLLQLLHCIPNERDGGVHAGGSRLGNRRPNMRGSPTEHDKLYVQGEHQLYGCRQWGRLPLPLQRWLQRESLSLWAGRLPRYITIHFSPSSVTCLFLPEVRDFFQLSYTSNK